MYTLKFGDDQRRFSYETNGYVYSVDRKYDSEKDSTTYQNHMDHEPYYGILIRTDKDLDFRDRKYPFFLLNYYSFLGV